MSAGGHLICYQRSVLIGGRSRSDVTQENPKVRWFTPDKPDNISVGRERIASHLRQNEGFSVEVVGTTSTTVQTAIRERDRYDVILGTTRAGAIAGTLIGRLTGKPVIVDHIDPIRQFREGNPPFLSIPVRIAENVSFALAELVLYVYEEEHERVSRYASQHMKTELGVDYCRFANPNSEIIDSVQDQLAECEFCENIAIYVGGLEPIYHIKELLMAMSNLPDWSLIILGEGSLRGVVEKVDAGQENVHYLGLVPHESIPGYLNVADVGVSLVDDPHTLKILEYGAAGLSVVQASGLAEERFRERVEYANPEPESIADAIKRAGEHKNVEQLQSFISEFDWKQIAGDYADALKSIK